MTRNRKDVFAEWKSDAYRLFRQQITQMLNAGDLLAGRPRKPSRLPRIRGEGSLPNLADGEPNGLARNAPLFSNVLRVISEVALLNPVLLYIAGVGGYFQ